MDKRPKRWSISFKRKLCSPFFPIISFCVILLGGVLGLQLVPGNNTLAWQSGCQLGSNASLAMTASSSVNFTFNAEELSASSLKSINLKVGLSTNNCYGATASLSSVDEGTSLISEDPAIHQKIDSIGIKFSRDKFCC